MSSLISESSEVFHCLALDPVGAMVREDGFFVEENETGWVLVVVGIIPPLRFLNTEVVDMCLKNLPYSKMPQSINLFNRDIKRYFGLREGVSTPVIAVKFSVSYTGEVFSENVFPSSATVSWIQHGDHQEEEICNKAKNLIDLIYKKHKHTLARRSFHWCFRYHDGSDFMYDQQLVHSLCDLFNDACRNFCRVNGIPFFDFLKRKNTLLISPIEYGRFNRPLRDVLSLINVSNLQNFLNEERPIVTEEEMKKAVNEVYQCS